MTEIEAIKLSLDLWGWLNKHPLKAKEHYPQFKKIQKYFCYCPCCSYFSKINDRHCSDCPLTGDTCANSFFDKWYKAETKEQSQKASGEIVRRLQERYNELLKEKK